VRKYRKLKEMKYRKSSGIDKMKARKYGEKRKQHHQYSMAAEKENISRRCGSRQQL